MDPKKAWTQLTKEQRAAIAKAGETTVGRLRNVFYGCGTCSLDLAMQIELCTTEMLGSHKSVTRLDLIPDRERVFRTWPTLRGQEPEAPAVPTGEVA
jgi:hypothetical protein